ncbi:MAG: nucleotide-binding protein [Candidatus Thiodiazotropha sp. (ex. Lucinisca nassula)]|nr:nucleotide-binding protein [Candidatus Thiodiazotropha sp. (ex. Lucinisca nassula)]
MGSEEENRTRHLIVKWNPFARFHEDAPDTIKVHCEILHKNCNDSSSRFVWWGKISKSGKLGLDLSELADINFESAETHLYLYCPDTNKPSMHVGKIEGYSLEDKRKEPNCPNYYKDLKNDIPIWFKISDICKVPLDALHNLILPSNDEFDPVASISYPSVVYEKLPKLYFSVAGTYKALLKEYIMRCFKTGNDCAVKDVSVKQNRIFIGRPFSQKYQNSYKYAIKPILDELGYEAWKADEVFKSIDLMCKVCEGIQTSRAAIIDISGWSSNVLFELGMVYGLSREAIILKEESEELPVDLKGLIYIPYRFDDFDGLQNQLKAYLQAWEN